MSADKSIAAARELIGKKWRHRARGPMAYDCIGLVAYALRSGGLVVQDRLDYGREPWATDNLQKECKQRFGEPTKALQPGHIALFAWPISPMPCHIGLIGNSKDGLTLIHSHSRYNCTEHLLAGKWKKLFVEAYNPWPR